MKPVKVRTFRTRNTPDDYKSCADKGMTRTETAEHLGASYMAVCKAAKNHNINFKPSSVGRPAKHESKLGILLGMKRGDMTYSDMTTLTGIGDSTIRWHVARLCELGIIELKEKVGNTAIFGLCDTSTIKNSQTSLETQSGRQSEGMA